MALLRTGTRFPFWDEGFLGLCREGFTTSTCPEVTSNQKSSWRRRETWVLSGNPGWQKSMEIPIEPIANQKIVASKSSWENPCEILHGRLKKREFWSDYQYSRNDFQGCFHCWGFQVRATLVTRPFKARCGDCWADDGSFLPFIQHLGGSFFLPRPGPLVLPSGSNCLPWKDPPFFNGKTMGRPWEDHGKTMGKW